MTHEDSLLALTSGEPAGCGPDITIYAWKRRHRYRTPPFLCVTDPGLIHQRSRELGEAITIEECTAREAARVFDTALPVLPLAHPFKDVIAGNPQPANSDGVVAAIEVGTTLVTKGECAGLVTNPIQKSTLTRSGFAWPGHTEFMGVLAERHGLGKTSPTMMMIGGGLRTVPATVHMSVADALAHLTQARIERLCTTIHSEMKRYFALPTPKIAVCGLNPHAGEPGRNGHSALIPLLCVHG